MKKFSRKHYYIIGGIIVLIIAWMFGAQKRADVPYEFVIVERADLVQEVGVTGRVKPAERVNLAFETSGKVAWVRADVGDNVQQGQALVSLVSSDVVAQLQQAQALVQIEEAKLEELTVGTREQEIRVQEVKVDNAEKSVEDARMTVVNTLHEAYTSSDDAVRNKVDQFISNPRGTDPQLIFSLNDAQLEIVIEAGRVEAEQVLSNWELSLNTLAVGSDLSVYTAEAQNNLTQLKDYMSDIAFAVNGLKQNVSFSQTVIDGYRSDIATARTNINTVIAGVSTTDEALRDADSALSLAQEELVLKRAGTRAEQLLAQEAKLAEARASVRRFEADVAKTVIRAPFSGVVTVQEAEVGEIVAANTAVVELISAAEFEIEMFVPEADIAKLELHDTAEVTLDAYGSATIFTATVTSINPAETIIDGVSTYKTILQFKDKDTRVRSGMTANITIVTESREDVISVPGRAVIFNNGQRFVRVVDNRGNIIQRSVTIGIRGFDGSLEVVDGLQIGEKVITFLEE